MPTNPSWSRIRSHLLTLNKDDLLKVIQDLYQLNNDNKVFLNSHLGMGNSETLAQPYRKTIKQVFNPDRGFPSLSLRSAQKALNDFRKASLGSAHEHGDDVELLMTLSELENFIGYVAAEANHAKTRKQSDDLNQICDYLETVEYTIKSDQEKRS